MKLSLPRIQPPTVPIALFFVCLFSFGLFIPFLGFYWDDWPLILTGNWQGTDGFWQYWQYDRPMAAWTYAAAYPLLGTQALSWQIATFLLRWGTAAAGWWTLVQIWPEQKRIAAWTSFLFAVYPVFTQQPISVAYNQHWLCFLLFLLSLGSMLLAHRNPRWFWPLTIFALTASLVQLFTIEYFVGLELSRPFLLWMLFSERPGSSFSGRLKATLRASALYCLVLGFFIAWRLFFVNLPIEDRNAPILLATLMEQPAAGILELLQMALQDVSFIIVTNWYTVFRPTIFDLSDRFSIFVLGAGLVSAALTGAYHFLRNREAETSDAVIHKLIAPMLIGLLLVFLGALPGWVTGRQVIIGAYSDRLAIPAMFGASLFLASLSAWLIRGHIQQILAISLLVGLATSANLRIANDYRWAKIQQTRFYWQLHWRAPQIEPQTAVFANAEILPKMGLYSTAAGINFLYPNESPSANVPYWFFSLSRQFSHQMPELMAGMPLETDFRQISYRGESSNSLVIYYEPNNADCLRVLTKEDVHDPALSEIVVQSLPITNLERIQSEPSANSRTPDVQIFGPEPEQGWCYYFEKADLARQTKDWQQVASLGDTARDLGHTLKNSQSNTPQEWIPFIQGYGMVGRWDESYALTRSVLEREPKMSARLCDVWSALKQEGLPAQNIDPMLQELSCVTE